MKKDLLRIMSVLLITSSLFCGCSTDKKVGANREESVTQEEEVKKEAEAKATQEREKQTVVQAQQDSQQQQSTPSNNAQPNGETVYVASSGKGQCYHKDSNCSKMKGKVNSMSRSEAEQKNLRPCKKCYK